MSPTTGSARNETIDSRQSRATIITTTPDERDDVAHRVERAGGEELAHRVDVVRGARDEAPDRRAVVVAQAQPLEEAEDGAPQIGHRARAGDLHRVHLHEGEELRDDEEQRQGDAVAHQAGRVAGRRPGGRRRP